MKRGRPMALALDAKETFVSEFDAFVKTLDRGQPDWLAGRRREAIATFRKLGFPTTKHEDWKYTNLAPLLQVPFRPAILGRPERIPQEQLEAYTFGVLKTSLLVFVNGRYARRLSYLRPLPEGVRVASLAEVLRDEPEAVEVALGRRVRIDDNAFAALNAAFLQDGAFVEIPKNTTVEEPIHLLFLSSSRDSPLVSYPRNLILLGPRSRAAVIETYAGWSPDVYLTDAVTEVAVGPASALDHYTMVRESEAGFHMGTMSVDQDRDTSVVCHSISLGGKIARNTVITKFHGEGGSLLLNGLFMTEGTQQADNYTRIDHAAPACTSVELYKGILNDRSRGVFNGNIVVRPGAQKTVARQTNKNLLVSKDAFVDSTPGLEILADDVKCSHASTIGQLDEAAIFYLRTRGIDEEASRHILTYAFIADVVNQVKEAPIRIKLDRLILSRLPRVAGLEETP
ncbi:MAG TPA: Fe-S cluster assembly protein SufD [Thermoplasmata archaeon]|nr:Fe-S cluster assembly protein SufD [Thermoplasmata archaeon]